MRSRGDGKLLLQVWRTAGRRHRRNNGEIIRSLYALRAGLSVISQKADEVKEYEEKISQRKQTRNSYKQAINNSKTKLAKIAINNLALQDLYDKEKPLEEEKKRKIEILEKKKQKRTPWEKALNKLGVVFLVLSAISACGFLLGSCHSCISCGKIELPLFAKILGIVCGANVFVLLCCYFTTLAFGTDSLTKEIAQLNSELNNTWTRENQLKTNNKCIPKLEKYIVECTNVLDNIEDDSFDKKQISLLRSDAKKIYNVLVSKFSSTIDPRDWENLDIIIYMLETRRADSMRDALNRTDLALRHEDIKSTLVTVGRQIQNSISTLAGRIGRLSYEIAESGRQTSAMLGSLNTSMLNASEAERALLEKANTNSRQLMSDVGRLRHYAELDAREKGYIN